MSDVLPVSAVAAGIVVAVEMAVEGDLLALAERELEVQIASSGPAVCKNVAERERSVDVKVVQ